MIKSLALATILALSPLCASEGMHVIRPAHSTEKELANGLQDGAILFFEAGDTFVFNFDLSGDLLVLDGAEGNAFSLTFAHDLWIKTSEGGLRFSLDGETWGDFTDFFFGSIYGSIDEPGIFDLSARIELLD